jgi:hypothetical protein
MRNFIGDEKGYVVKGEGLHRELCLLNNLLHPNIFVILVFILTLLRDSHDTVEH